MIPYEGKKFPIFGSEQPDNGVDGIDARFRLRRESGLLSASNRLCLPALRTRTSSLTFLHSGLRLISSE
ncbi:MAG: hypothetical protein C3F11_17275 [Methylocystaceae bacterium]|nr:MAG: hypothetical protein C3F11_17275 [Methylocystaceae bacterium]